MEPLDINAVRQILERAQKTTFEDDSEWWIEFITKILDLPLFCYPAVKLALDECQWDKAASPIKYVKSTAWRKARFLGLLSDDSAWAGWRISDQVTQWNTAGATHDAIIDTLEYKFDQKHQERVEPSVLDCTHEHCVTGRYIDWDSVLGKINASDELWAYIRDRLRGVRGGNHSEAARKQFQRQRKALQVAILCEIEDAQKPDKETTLRLLLNRVAWDAFRKGNFRLCSAALAVLDGPLNFRAEVTDALIKALKATIDKSYREYQHKQARAA
ncbi:MAG: hypothetical protein KJZ78_06650 [Bryobacteraceae bacterium]|nr:hypothetical protein [Bryobacteraceae bacterium]